MLHFQVSLMTHKTAVFLWYNQIQPDLHWLVCNTRLVELVTMHKAKIRIQWLRNIVTMQPLNHESHYQRTWDSFFTHISASSCHSLYEGKQSFSLCSPWQNIQWRAAFLLHLLPDSCCLPANRWQRHVTEFCYTTLVLWSL